MSDKTLVVSIQGIGNNLLALPLAATLSRQDGKPVGMLVRSVRAAALLSIHKDVGEAIALHDERYRGAAGLVRLRAKLRSEGFRRAVFAFPSGGLSVLFAAASGIKERIGLTHYAMGPFGKLLTKHEEAEHGRHDLEQNAIIAGLAGAEMRIETDWPTLSPTQGRVENAKAFLEQAGFDPAKRYIGLHTGCDGGFIEKRWPEKHFAALAEAIHDQFGLTAIVFDGPDEAGSGKRVARMARTPVLPMDGWGTLPDALGMLAFCDVFVSNDSGLMNLAAASGVPTVAVFGPSVASRTRPWGEKTRVLRTERPCTPCYDLGKWGGCAHPERPCLEDIRPESVALAAAELLGS